MGLTTMTITMNLDTRFWTDFPNIFWPDYILFWMILPKRFVWLSGLNWSSLSLISFFRAWKIGSGGGGGSISSDFGLGLSNNLRRCIPAVISWQGIFPKCGGCWPCQNLWNDTCSNLHSSMLCLFVLLFTCLLGKFDLMLEDWDSPERKNCGWSFRDCT